MPVPLRWAYLIREVRRRPVRWLVTLTGVVLGVAAVTAVLTAIDATRGGYAGLNRAITGRATYEVLPPPGQRSFQPKQVRFGGSPVEAAVGVVVAPTALLTADGPVPFLLLGVKPEEEAAVRTYQPPLPEHLHGGILLERGFAARHGLAVGDWVHFNTVRARVTMPITGLLDPVGPMRFNGGAIGIVDRWYAASVFAKPTEVTAVHVVLSRGGGGVDVIAPAGAIVHRADESPRLAYAFLLSFEQMLMSLAAIAAVAGGLVVHNTFLIHLSERRRQLALFRALGATRRQVTGHLLRQALLVGGVGTLIGLPLGIALASLLLSLNAWFLGIGLARWAVSPQALGVAALLGPTLTVLPCVVLSWQLNRSPLADLRPRRDEPRASSGPLLGVSLTLVALALLYAAALVVGWMGSRAGTVLMPFAAAAALLGCAGLLQTQTPALLSAFGWLRVLGVEMRLALRHTASHPHRTALTAGVLFATLVTAVAFGTSYLNSLADIRRWYAATIPEPYFVRAVLPDPALSVAIAPLPARVYDEVRKLPGVAAVHRVRLEPIEVGGVEALLLAREVSGEGPLPLVIEKGEAADVRERLRAGEAVLGPALAARLGVTVGDEVPVGGRSVRVCGIVKEYSVGGLVVQMDYLPARALLHFESPHTLAVETADEAALRGLCERRGLLLQANREFAGVITRVADGALWLVRSILILVAVMAAAGVVNTLTTTVLDQRRELGLLRAVGMQRHQVSRLVMAQALVLALVAIVAGVPAGLGIAYLMNVTTPALLGQSVPFRVVWWLPAVASLVVLVLSLLSAWLPARHAARTDVTDAMRAE